MSNHVHLLTKSYTGQLSDTVRDLKRHTSKKIVEQVIEGRESRRKWLLHIFESAAKQHKRNNKYQLWIHENHPENIYSNKLIAQKITYIHDNPVRAGLVEKPEEYVYSSAKAYAGESCIFECNSFDVAMDNLLRNCFTASSGCCQEDIIVADATINAGNYGHRGFFLYTNQVFKMYR